MPPLCDSAGCTAHHQFTPAKSHTYLNGTEPDFDIEYGQGGVLVHPARDSVALGAFRDEGYLPDAMVNYLALLGWGPADEQEIRPLAEIGSLDQ